jgi:hypothetical protein
MEMHEFPCLTRHMYVCGLEQTLNASPRFHVVRSCGGATPRCRITRLCIVLRAASRAYPASFAAFLRAPHHPRDTQSLIWPSVVGLLVLIYGASSAGTIDPNRNSMTSSYTLFLSIWSMMFLQVSLHVCDTPVLGCHIHT